MTQTTTSGTQPATLNERELFNAFLKVTIERNISIGGERVSEPSYTPLELLLEAGSYGELDDVTMMLLDYISDAEDPEETIQALHDDLAIYVDNLATVLSGFKAFKSIHSVEDDLGDEPEDQHSEAYKEWSDAWDELQRNPRFLVPTALEEAV